MRLRASIRRARSFVAILLLVCILLPAGTSLAEITFVNNQFQAKWQRADKPVQDTSAKPSRSWLWGPEGFNQPNVTTEPYAQSPGGQRQVQYFDKARMELNNPSSGLVTNGLLVRELISGREATGDATDITRKPADDIPVAGDAVSNDGPTYASLKDLASLNLDHPSADRTGQQVVDTLDKAGKTGTNAQLGSQAKYVYFDSTLKHNIPDVFWNFMNQKGTVFEDGKLTENLPVLGSNPAAPWLDATGYPLSEAYWAKVTVGGQVKDVLMQAFERRVLTFTPSNPDAFKVEMGNVGRHYFVWRYSARYDIAVSPPTTTPPTTTPPTTTPPTNTVTSCDKLPASTGRTFFPCGPAGMPVVVVADLQANEEATVDALDPNGNRVRGFRGLAAASGQLKGVVDTLTTDPTGMWTLKIKGQTSGKEAVIYIWLDAPVSKPTIFISPTTAHKNEVVNIMVVGFKPKESLQIGVKCPCGTVFSTSGNILATNGGGFIDEFLLTRDLPKDFQLTGVWGYSIFSKDTANGSGTVGGQFTIIN